MSPKRGYSSWIEVVLRGVDRPRIYGHFSDQRGVEPLVEQKRRSVSFRDVPEASVLPTRLLCRR